MNEGITVFLNDEEITTGNVLMTCTEERIPCFGRQYEGEGPKALGSLDLEVTSCHTDLTTGKVSVSFFGVMFDGVVRSRDTKFGVDGFRPDLHTFSIALVPLKDRHNENR